MMQSSIRIQPVDRLPSLATTPKVLSGRQNIQRTVKTACVASLVVPSAMLIMLSCPIRPIGQPCVMFLFWLHGDTFAINFVP